MWFSIPFFSRSPAQPELKFSVELSMVKENVVFNFKGTQKEVDDKTAYVKKNLFNDASYMWEQNEFEVQGIKGNQSKLFIPVCTDNQSKLSQLFCYLASIGQAFDAEEFFNKNAKNSPLVYTFIATQYLEIISKIYQAMIDGKNIDPNTLPATEVKEEIKTSSYYDWLPFNNWIPRLW